MRDESRGMMVFMDSPKGWDKRHTAVGMRPSAMATVTTTRTITSRASAPSASGTILSYTGGNFRDGVLSMILLQLLIGLQQADENFVGEGVHAMERFVEGDVGFAVGMDDRLDQRVAKEQKGLPTEMFALEMASTQPVISNIPISM